MNKLYCLSLLMLSACNAEQAAVMSAAINSDSPIVGENLVIDCSASPLLGTWNRVNANMNDTWVFNSDCTAEHVGCGLKVTIPNDVDSLVDMFDATIQSEGINASYCSPNTLQPQTGVRAMEYLKIDANRIKIHGIWQGLNEYQRVQ